MEAFLPIAEAVADDSTVFVYDRAGYGSSDAAEGPRDGSTIVEELGAVLTTSGHQPPYLLVGHSMGAVYVRLFAQTYPQEVAGVVQAQRLQAAALQTELVMAEGSGHFIQFDRPDLVLDAIRVVVDQIRREP